MFCSNNEVSKCNKNKLQEDAAFIMANSEESQKSSKIKNNIFENEEMSRHLRKLLHSKDPYDLQTANRLIKVMVKEVRLFKI